MTMTQTEKIYFYDIILELFVKEIYWLLDHQPISVSLVDSYLMSIFNLKSSTEKTGVSNETSYYELPGNQSARDAFLQKICM